MEKNMKTAVITAGGLGTRLLTFTKVAPKAILPIYSKTFDYNNEPIMKPLIEHIFDNLYDLGFRKFCFIVNKISKSLIKDHFVTDQKFIKLLENRNSIEDKRFLKIIKTHDKKLKNSEIKWIIQESPSGFGDALSHAKKFVGDETFILHAADAYFPNYLFMKNFISNFDKQKADCSIIVEKRNKIKGYGIAEFKKKSDLVIHVEEKPKYPKSNFAILPVYIFKPKIFDALKKTSIGYNGELQVTDGIMTLIKNKNKVIGLKYLKKWFDIGSPKNYFNAINYSYKKI